VRDEEVLDHIRGLMEEEQRLRAAHGAGGEGLDAGERERLQALEVALDQCWDLLRQRRARREFGENPDQAAARDIGTVEGYRQ
jgi:hypothetical protein